MLRSGDPLGARWRHDSQVGRELISPLLRRGRAARLLVSFRSTNLHHVCGALDPQGGRFALGRAGLAGHRSLKATEGISKATATGAAPACPTAMTRALRPRDRQGQLKGDAAMTEANVNLIS
jgi:hypothetical protein